MGRTVSARILEFKTCLNNYDPLSEENPRTTSQVVLLASMVH
jgi:hypothetical protein